MSSVHNEPINPISTVDINSPDIARTSAIIDKAFFLLKLTLFIALVSGLTFLLFPIYSPDLQQDVPSPYLIQPTLVFAGVGGLLFYTFALNKPERFSPLCAKGFAVCQGLVLGGLCSYTWSIFFNLIGLSILSALLGIAVVWYGYTQDLIRPTKRFRKMVRSLVYLVSFWYLFSFIGALFYHIDFSIIYGNTWSGIIFSAAIGILACLETLICIQDVAVYEKHGIVREMEWYFALELLAGVLWVYIEMLILWFKILMKWKV